MEFRIGRHEVSQVDDVLIMRVRGAFSLEDAKDYVCVREAVRSQQKYLLLLIDVREATSMPPEARRYIAGAGSATDPHNGALALYGARPLIRGLLQLLFSAVTLLGKRPVFASFVSDEAAAYQFLSEQRQRILQRLPHNLRDQPAS